MKKEIAWIGFLGWSTLIIAALGGCSPAPSPWGRVSADDPRVVLMLKELEHFGPDKGYATVPNPLEGSVDIWLQPSAHGAHLCLYAQGVARIINFRKAPDDGYRWSGEATVYSNGDVIEHILTVPTVIELTRKWDRHEVREIRLQPVNRVQNVSVQLNSTNALPVGQGAAAKDVPNSGYVIDATAATGIAKVVLSRLLTPENLKHKEIFDATLMDGIWTVESAELKVRISSPIVIQIRQKTGAIVRYDDPNA